MEEHKQERGTTTATNELLQLAIEGRDIAAGNAELIDRQGKQFDGIERSVDQMKRDQTTADWLVRGVTSYTGAVLNYFSSPPLAEKVQTPSTLSTSESDWVVVEESNKPKEHLQVDDFQLNKQREKDDSLAQVRQAAGELKVISKITKAHLEKQNEKLDKIGDEMSITNEKMKKNVGDLKKYNRS
eukprot:TRINITY_DN23757_c0_g1_i1.p1 TRINITY_DN23757_c0_g1~~TRINITY_DN23757_c0_g1_i1.p1  ORF type:complete len:185 (+),score=53.42 TRINITY_DN23757_c0_g1_i1:615-1169(+)